jgi:hypothetical protein
VNGQILDLLILVLVGAVEEVKVRTLYFDHNPCGSSAGSGVAVSANLCTVSVGTETDGSVVCPFSKRVVELSLHWPGK